MAILRGFPPSNTISCRTYIPLSDLVDYWEQSGIPYDRDTLIVQGHEGEGPSDAPWKQPGLTMAEREVARFNFWHEFKEKHGYDPREVFAMNLEI